MERHETEPDWNTEDPFDPEAYSNRAAGGDGGRDRDAVPPPRKYPFQITQWEIREPQEEGKYPYLNLALEIQQEGPFKGKWIWDILSYSPKCAVQWSALWYALGWTPDHGTFDRTDPNVLASWLDAGITVWAKTKIDTWKGQRRAKIAYYINASEAPTHDGVSGTSTRGGAGPRAGGGRGDTNTDDRADDKGPGSWDGGGGDSGAGGSGDDSAPF